MMADHTLVEYCKSGHMTATIISVADACRYQVGVEDKQGNFFSLNTSTSSLDQAKAYVRGLGIDSAVIEWQSAYDEMIGLNDSGVVRQAVIL